MYGLRNDLTSRNVATVIAAAIRESAPDKQKPNVHQREGRQCFTKAVHMFYSECCMVECESFGSMSVVWELILHFFVIFAFDSMSASVVSLLSE